MKANKIVSLLDAKPILIFNQHLMNKEYSAAFASDLMSDALAMIQNSPESVVLITGLCNSQVLRTAEMLDLQIIIFVRGKQIDDEMMEIAKDMGINIFTTEHTMYETCGILYQEGLKGIHELNPS